MHTPFRWKLFVYIGCSAPFLYFMQLRGPLELSTHLRLLWPFSLTLLALVPWVVWHSRNSLADLPRLQRRISTTLRMILLTTLIFAISRPQLKTKTGAIHGVILLDMSSSVSKKAYSDIRAFVDGMKNSAQTHPVDLVGFAQGARRLGIAAFVDLKSSLQTLRSAEKEVRIDRGTDIEYAVVFSYGLFEPEHSKRIVLITDGIQTQGYLRNQIPELKRLGISVDTWNAPHMVAEETAAIDLQAQGDLRVGASLQLITTVHSSTSRSLELRWRQIKPKAKTIHQERVDLVQGINSFATKFAVHDTGEHIISASFAFDAEFDQLKDNNDARVWFNVPGPPRVWIIASEGPEALYAQRAIAAANYSVKVSKPISMNLNQQNAPDFIVLSNITPKSLSQTQMVALRKYVHDGGGLLIAGDIRAFGAEGFFNTPLSPLLPVMPKPAGQLRQPDIAITLVIDKSGSMQGTKIEMAKQAAVASAEVLSPYDHIAVIGFDSRPSRIVSLQPAQSQHRIHTQIERLSSGGGTAIFPALDMAYQELSLSEAKTKHVILLTDGQTQEPGLLELVQTMSADGIGISTVGLGQDVHQSLLESLATLGGGRAYFTDDPYRIPRIFAKETSTISIHASEQTPTALHADHMIDALAQFDWNTTPWLRAYIPTIEKEKPAEVILRSDTADPILARRPYGVGWTLTWLSDLSSRWAVEWVRWPRFSAFLSQIIAAHRRQSVDKSFPLLSRYTNGRLELRLDVYDDGDRFVNKLKGNVVLTPLSGHGQPKTVPMMQTAPGRYAALTAPPEGPHWLAKAQLYRQNELVAEAHANLPNSLSQEFFSPSKALANTSFVSQATGGKALSKPGEFWRKSKKPVVQTTPLWHWLIFVALVLFVIDVASRRIRWIDKMFSVRMTQQ